MRRAGLFVAVVVLACVLAYGAVAAIAATIPHEESMVKIHDPVVMRVFPAPHTERAYFLWLAKRLG